MSPAWRSWLNRLFPARAPGRTAWSLTVRPFDALNLLKGRFHSRLVAGLVGRIEPLEAWLQSVRLELGDVLPGLLRLGWAIEVNISLRQSTPQPC